MSLERKNGRKLYIFAQNFAQSEFVTEMCLSLEEILEFRGILEFNSTYVKSVKN